MSSVTNNTILIPAAAMQEMFYSILIKNGLPSGAATQCAAVFTRSSVDGVYTHGVNRFPRFVEYIQKGYVNTNAVPALKNKTNGIEQWDGNLGPGIVNAAFATERSMQLAKDFGIGCVALSNTHHWMRGGAYGWQAAKAGFVFIGWTNTIANMPAWGATDARLGNNPLVLAIPYKDEAIVLDMAMSQYSFGSMELASMKNEKLKMPGGFDSDGNITDDPAAILDSRRPMPTGYWKGAGLSLLLDILAAVLSGGLATHEISKQEAEFGLSQVFIAVDITKMGTAAAITPIIENIIADYKNSVPAGEGDKILFPGERVLQARKTNLEKGIPVLEPIWDAIVKLDATT